MKWLVIDEADKMFEGSTDQESDFRQQLEQIMSSCDGKERRIAMLSATHTPAIAKWSRHNLRGLINITVGHRFDFHCFTLIFQKMSYFMRN